MLKELLVASLVGVSIFCAGCGEDKADNTYTAEQQAEDKARFEKMEADKKTAQEKAEAEKAAAAKLAEEMKAIKVCSTPGIGDDLSWFSESHKLEKDNGMQKNYDNNHFIVMASENDRIMHITVQSGNKPRDPAIDEMIPLDATDIQERVDDSDSMLSRRIKTGHSETLAKIFPKDNGVFCMSDTYDKASGKYLNSVISTGEYK